MTIKELDDKLNSPGFQDTENGDLFYNFFIYQYPAEKEYDIRRQIQEFKANLIRPINYVDVLTLNLFEEFCNFLDQKKFLRHPSMLKYQLEKEQNDPSKAQNTQDTLTRNAHSPEFVQYIHQRIIDHITIKDQYRRPYVFLYGIGSMFPYLRVNEFLPSMRTTTIPGSIRLSSSILVIVTRTLSVCLIRSQTITLIVQPYLSMSNL